MNEEVEILRRERDILAKLITKRRREELFYYQPYPKQYEFHAANGRYLESMIMAGNQLAKTYAGSREVAMHMTGIYPDWWPGRCWDRAVTVWTGSPSNATSRDIIQRALLGTTMTEMDAPDMGTGSIPGDCIVDIKTRQAQVKNVVDEIYVQHVSGGISSLATKIYEQDASKLQGTPIDIWWPDEEPPQSHYSEGVTRTQARKGLTMMTFTPLGGYSKVVESYLDPKPDDRPKHVVNMTIYDAVGGIWPPGTPWEGQEWAGHYTREEAEDIIRSYPPEERATRAMGQPMQGSGRIYPINEHDLLCPAFQIPAYFFRIKGCDFGWDHPGAGCELAWDRTNDVVYLIWSYKKAEEEPPYHARMLARGFDNSDWVPIAWPHDGVNTKPGGGKPVMEQYRDCYANMLPLSARYDDQVGGSQDTEPIILEMLDRMRTHRFKIFNHQTEILEEIRMYHRKTTNAGNSVIVKRKDDILSAVHYAMMMKDRYSMQRNVPVLTPQYTKPIARLHA